VLFTPCNLLPAQYIIEPGPTGVNLPSTVMSPVPRVITMISSSGCWWGGCGIMPGFSLRLPASMDFN